MTESIQRILWDWFYIIVAGIFVLLIAWGTLADAAECLPSFKAAREAHPTAHISWGGGCYYEGYPRKRHVTERKVMPVADSKPRHIAIVPVSATPAVFDKEAEFVRLEHMAEEILWRKGMSGRIGEWFYVFNKSPCIEDERYRVYSFSERWPGAFPKGKV